MSGNSRYFRPLLHAFAETRAAAIARSRSINAFRSRDSSAELKNRTTLRDLTSFNRALETRFSSNIPHFTALDRIELRVARLRVAVALLMVAVASGRTLSFNRVAHQCSIAAGSISLNGLVRNLGNACSSRFNISSAPL